MKQRFSSLDVKVIAHELSQTVVGLRLANVYDLSSKILLLKFAKPDVKKQLIIDSGFRCHLTEFVRTTAAAPSAFVARLRKFLKTRRVTGVTQIGTDRIIEFQFIDGSYRLFLEFFASGNVILTDRELKILTLLRIVSEGEGQEPQRVGLAYNLENRQNYSGIPPLTVDRLRSALRVAVDKAAAQPTAKKAKSKPGEELRKGLATTVVELPPVLIDHALAVMKFDVQQKPADIVESEPLLDSLLQSLELARKIVEEITSSPTCKGYIFAIPKPPSHGGPGEADLPANDATKDGLYEDFHPFLPQKYVDNPNFKVLSFEGFNKTVDEFFSSLEGQKLASRLDEREAAARRKLDAARQDQAKRIGGLQEAQSLNARKAAAIEANVERVQEAVDAVNGLVRQGMDWHTIGKLIEREQTRGNPVAEIFELPVRIAENTITLLLGEEDFEDEDEDEDGDGAGGDYETDPTDSNSDADENATSASASVAAHRKPKPKPKAVLTDTRLAIDINLGLSPWANAREYHDQKRQAAVKEHKTEQQTGTALRNAEQKIAVDLKRTLQGEKAVLHPLRRQLWFEKFIWFVSSDGYLVLGGRDAQQNEVLYRRHLRRGDVYVHADLHGAASVVIKNDARTPDAPVPPSTLSQAGHLSVCASTAWDAKAGMAAWWVGADQVSKSAPTGEFLPAGSFMVRGKKNFLPPAQLLLGFGLLFRISEESRARHVKHRLYNAPEEEDGAVGGKEGEGNAKEVDEEAGTRTTVEQSPLMPRPDDGLDEGAESDRDSEVGEDAADDDEEDDDDDEQPSPRSNPLQVTGGQKGENHDLDADNVENIDDIDDIDNIENIETTTREVSALQVSDITPAAQAEVIQAKAEDEKKEEEEEDDDERENNDQEAAPAHQRQPAATGAPSASPTPQKKAPPKRGQRGKAKKMAAKYAEQDDEDRAIRAALTGAAAGQAKREAEAQAKAQREADLAAQAQRRQAQRARAQREAAEQEEIRRVMLAEGVDVLDAAEEEQATPLDALVGTPLPGDEILEAVPLCAPWSAMARVKYKAKLQPGAQKKGKAVKEIVERWKIDAKKKGAVDTEARDVERMWPREVELIRGLRAEEMFNCVPVGKVRVMTSGGGGGGGEGNGKGKGAAGKGGKGQKKKK